MGAPLELPSADRIHLVEVWWDDAGLWWACHERGTRFSSVAHGPIHGLENLMNATEEVVNWDGVNNYQIRALLEASGSAQVFRAVARAIA